MLVLYCVRLGGWSSFLDKNLARHMGVGGVGERRKGCCRDFSFGTEPACRPQTKQTHILCGIMLSIRDWLARRPAVNGSVLGAAAHPRKQRTRACIGEVSLTCQHRSLKRPIHTLSEMAGRGLLRCVGLVNYGNVPAIQVLSRGPRAILYIVSVPLRALNFF